MSGWLRWALLLPAMAALTAWGQPSSSGETQPRSSEDGAYVIDPRSKLAWPRCVEGMTWNGKACAGQARLMSYGEAQALASARFRSEGVAWRLPRLTELRRWAATAQMKEFFPGDPADWTWSSTTRIDTVQSNPYSYDNIARGSTGTQDRLGVQQGWAVNMDNGEARGDVSRRTQLVVRLVRPQP